MSGIEFTFAEMMAMIEDLMRVADDLLAAGDSVNAFLVDQVANQLLDRSFGVD